MIYIIYGLELFLINKKLKEIIDNSNIDSNSITRYDLENTTIQTIIDDANSIDLFANQKIIIVDNAYIFTATTNKKLMKQNTEIVEKYFNDPNLQTTLIFIVNKDKLDVRKKIYKLAKTNGTILECSLTTSINSLVKEMLDGYQIDSKTISLLLNRVGNNLAVLEQECQKIKTYKDNEKKITEEDVIHLTNKAVDIDIFHLIENIVSHHKEEAITSYYEMIRLGEEPIMILISLANQFRIIYQVKRLSSQGLSEMKIAEYLDIHSYRVKKALEKKYFFSEQQLIHYLSSLADLDYQIKSGTIDKNLGLELFILNE